jgi:hypothetical protein
VTDKLDREWADALRSAGKRPWITLLFGDPHTSSLNTSLTSIANGIHDDDLRRWARDLRDYGAPVYVTVLQHVDRDWALTSASARGGIPQDVPRAWERVRRVFAAEGTTNAAFIWNPADPAIDFDYAPPVASIDVVMVTILSYPGQSWLPASDVINRVTARYPGKPLIVEVGVAGSPDEKAAWLEETARDVQFRQNVVALVYHEGSPDPLATARDHEPWSLLSDIPTIFAVRRSWNFLPMRSAIEPSTQPAPNAQPARVETAGPLGNR